jgi:hypothetical protein
MVMEEALEINEFGCDVPLSEPYRITELCESPAFLCYMVSVLQTECQVYCDGV